jgi:di/tricarboxylate transporter
LTADLAIVLALLGAAVAMFVAGRPRMDVVGVLAVVALPLAGVLSVPEALAGFADANVLLIAALFVVGDGLVRTGVARRMGDWLVRRAGTSEPRMIALLMAVVATLGATMSSTGVVAIFIPVALRIAYRTNTSPSRIMMPLSFAGLISGMMTLVATPPNLVVSGELVRSGYDGFGFFAFTPFGVPVLGLGIAYMLVARRWLPGAGPAADDGTGAPRRRGRPSLADFARQYRLEDRQFRARVLPGSMLAGRTLADLRLRTTYRAAVVAVESPARGGRTLLRPAKNAPLEVGDVLLVEVVDRAVAPDDLGRRLGLEPLPLEPSFFADHSDEVGMAEVLLPPDSEFVGHTIADLALRSRYGLSVVGLRRNLKAFDEGLADEKLQPGDTLLLVGEWKAITALAADPADLIVLNLPAELADLPPARDRAPFALLGLGLMVALMITGLVPNVLAALLACLVMGAFGCVTMDSAYRAIHWPTLVLIIGMLPFATALEETGGVAMAASAMIDTVGRAGPYALLAGMFLVTAVTGLFVSNTATAVLIAPVAVSTAAQVGASPYPFAMVVALAASTAFVTPVSSPVNTLVLEPGRYRFADFVRVGLPFAGIVMVVTLVLVPRLLPLEPG